MTYQKELCPHCQCFLGWTERQFKIENHRYSVEGEVMSYSYEPTLFKAERTCSGCGGDIESALAEK